MVNYNIFISGVTAVDKEFATIVCRKVGDKNSSLAIHVGLRFKGQRIFRRSFQFFNF